MSKVQIVWFRDLVRWDIKHYLTEFKSKFPLVSLKDYIVEKKHRIKPSNFPNETFDILGVNNKDGVYFNESLLGSRIKQPYYQVRSGEIFYNPYRVNVGSIGIVPPEFDLKYTSPAYVIFQTDETRLLSQYLVFVLKSAWFNEHLRAKTRGSVRQNLSFEALCDLQIPLPPLEVQKQIVAKIESIKAQIKALQVEEKRLKDEIEAYIYIALGLEKKQELQRQKVFIVRFKDLDRWDTRHNQSIAINLCHTDSTPCHTDTTSTCHTNSPTHHSNPLSCHTEAIAEVSTNIESKFVIMSEANNLKKYNRDISPTAQYDNEMSRDISLPLNTTNLESLLDSIPTPPPHGWEVKTLGEICETNIGLVYTPANVSNDEKDIIVLRSNNIQNGKIVYDDLIRVKNIKISPNKIANKGDLLMCVRNGSANLIGKTAMIDRDGVSFGAFMAIIRSKYNKFLYHLLQCDYFRNYTTQSRTSGINQISQNDIKNFKIPLPPLSVQEKILAHIQKIESSIAATQEKAKALGLELTHYIESTL